MKIFEVGEQENTHTEDCIEGKFLSAVAAQLDTVLALSENGMLVPDEILDLMAAIFERDHANVKDLDKKD